MTNFSVSLSAIIYGLVAAVAAIVLYLLYLRWRNPVLVKIALRNIPRRPAQSTLIVIGLTLSTTLIVSALATGDTLTYSVRSHAITAYGQVDEIVAPPLLSQFAALAGEEGASTPATEELDRLFEGGLSSVLVVLEGGLPGIPEERFYALREEAAADPLIDGVAGSIIFPTIVRDVSTGQGEPFGFIFAVDDDYDTQFGLTNVEGQPVEMEDLQPGVGNIFAQASNLFGLVEDAGARLGLSDFSISDVALATAAAGAALTGASGQEGFDMAAVSIDLDTLRGLGVDTSVLEEQGVERLSLETLGLTPERLSSVGVTTTTLTLEDVGIDATGVQEIRDQILSSFNLNTLGAEIDRVLAQFGLQLRQGDLYLNRLGAERLNAQVGDVLEVYIGPIPVPFRVREIVDQAGPMGALAPVVMLRLSEAQQLLFMQGRVNTVLVSNLGDELEGVEHTAAVSSRLRELALEPAAVEQVEEILRRPEILAIVTREAQQADGLFDEEFDGPPFVEDIFRDVMQLQNFEQNVAALPAALAPGADPAALRTVLADTGVRQWLRELPLPAAAIAELEQALASLNQFDVLDPLNKSSILSVAGVGGAVFSSIFSVFGVFSILAGVLLIFLIFVMMAAARRSEMGMARAIGVQRTHLVQMFMTEGVVYDLLAAALGLLLGLGISYGMVGFLDLLFRNVSEQVGGQSGLFQIRFRAAPASLVLAYCLGVLFTFVVVTLSAWRVSRLNIVAAIRGLADTSTHRQTTPWRTLLRLLPGPLLMGGAVALFIYRPGNGLTVILLALTLLWVGALLLAGWWLARTRPRQAPIDRLVYSGIGVGLLFLWALPWSRWLATTLSLSDPAPWILLSIILTGPLVIIGAILVIMFNADTWTWAINRLLGGIGILTPVLKTAIAYPLSARFRTGITMLMFAMVISTVTIMTVVIDATQTLVAPDSERYAGFEISVSGTLLSFFSPLRDLRAGVAESADVAQSEIEAIGSVTERFVSGRLTGESASARTQPVRLLGVDSGYLDQAQQVYTLRQRAAGFDSDAAVWQALREREDVAIATWDVIVDESGREGLFFDGNGGGRGGDEADFMPPIRLPGEMLALEELPEIQMLLESAEPEGEPQHVQIIGIIAERSTLAGSGLQLNPAVLERVLGESPAPEIFYVKTAAGADVHEVAQILERAFLAHAVETTVLAESFAQGQALTRGVLQLLQGFLALGLLVGIAALGVISTRTVVERRQQVGMLRAIGFQPAMIALSFILESSFIAICGIGVGTAAGVVLGRNMLGIFYSALAGGRAFDTPWLPILAVVLLAYLFSLLTTVLPAYQASRIYPAEALRYE